MSKPLENIRILDLTRFVSGPYCTMLLADFGAEVIKIELPEKGDDSRSLGPFKNGKSLFFTSLNRWKKSVSLNLKTEKGKKILYDLTEKVDVVIENFRPGTMEKIGITYDKLKSVNPEIIYVSTSGFGQTGPDSKKAGLDLLIQALGGIMSITGWPDKPPTRVGITIGDYAASLFTTIGLLTALYHREVTGKGQRIDVAMLDSQVALLGSAILQYQVDGVPPVPLGNKYLEVAPFQVFKAKDDYIIIPVANDKLWKKFCIVIEREDLIYDKRFVSNKERIENIDELIPVIEKRISEKSFAEWSTRFDELQFPYSSINTVDKVLNNRQVLARNMIVEVEDKKAGKIKIPGNPIKMSSLKDEKILPPVPDIGENNLEILGDLLNLSKEEIKKLKDEGVI